MKMIKILVQKGGSLLLNEETDFDYEFIGEFSLFFKGKQTPRKVCRFKQKSAFHSVCVMEIPVYILEYWLKTLESPKQRVNNRWKNYYFEPSRPDIKKYQFEFGSIDINFSYWTEENNGFFRTGNRRRTTAYVVLKVLDKNFSWEDAMKYF